MHFYLCVSHFPETLLFFYLSSFYLSLILMNLTTRFYYPLSLPLLYSAQLFQLLYQLSRFPLFGVDCQVMFELLLLLNSNFWIKKFGRSIRQLVYERFLLYCCCVIFCLSLVWFWLLQLLLVKICLCTEHFTCYLESVLLSHSLCCSFIDFYPIF